MNLFNKQELEAIYEFARGKTRHALYLFVKTELKRTDVSERQIRSYTKNHPDLWEIMARGHNKPLLNEEQANFAYQFAPGRSNCALKDALNKKYGLDLTVDQICGWTKRRPDLRRQMVRRQHDMETDKEKMMNPTHVAQRYPIGAIRETESGATVKLLNGEKQLFAWKPRTRMVWENAHGYTDKHIAHLDGNVLNDSLDNLVEISLPAKAYMTKHHLWVYDDPDLTRARIAKAEVAALTCRLERERL